MHNPTHRCGFNSISIYDIKIPIYLLVILAILALAEFDEGYRPMGVTALRPTYVPSLSDRVTC